MSVVTTTAAIIAALFVLIILLRLVVHSCRRFYLQSHHSRQQPSCTRPTRVVRSERVFTIRSQSTTTSSSSSLPPRTLPTAPPTYEEAVRENTTAPTPITYNSPQNPAPAGWAILPPPGPYPQPPIQFSVPASETHPPYPK